VVRTDPGRPFGLAPGRSGEVNAVTLSVPTYCVAVLGIHAALITALSVAVVKTAAAQETTAPSRVRSESTLITDAIARGAKRSPTLRRLIETVDTTDGLVYIDEGLCGHSVRSCLHLSVVIAGPYRVLRILVNPRKAKDCDLVASIGHELQHAIEVLNDPNVRSNHEMFLFFHRVGLTSFDRFETKAAMQTGLAVDRECVRKN